MATVAPPLFPEPALCVSMACKDNRAPRGSASGNSMWRWLFSGPVLRGSTWAGPCAVIAGPSALDDRPQQTGHAAVSALNGCGRNTRAQLAAAPAHGIMHAGQAQMVCRVATATMSNALRPPVDDACLAPQPENTQ